MASYFLVADILGFSNIMENLKDEEQTRRIYGWIELVAETRRKTGVKEIQLISDTLFVKEEDSVHGLRRLLQFARLLLDDGIAKSIPLRGAIVYGEVIWGELTYGKAVVDAYRMERSLDWIGIACSPEIPGISQMWDWELVVVYPVPKKAGFTQYVPAISWNVPAAEELTKHVSQDGLLKDGDIIGWDVVSKVERTIQFGMYLRHGKANGLNPALSESLYPMQWIESLQ